MGECYIYFKEKNGDSQFIQNHAALMSTVKSKWFNLFDYIYLSDLNTICSLWIAKEPRSWTRSFRFYFRSLPRQHPSDLRFILWTLKMSKASVFLQHVSSYSWSVFFSSQVLKCEVELMAKMAKTIDGFTQNQTRLAVIIDGLDSCEQDKVLQMLDTVRVCLRCHAQPCIKHLPYNQVILYKSFLTARIAFSGVFNQCQEAFDGTSHPSPL